MKISEQHLEKLPSWVVFPKKTQKFLKICNMLQFQATEAPQ